MDLPLFEGDGYEEEGGDCQEVTWGGGEGESAKHIYMFCLWFFIFYLAHVLFFVRNKTGH